MGKTWVDLIYNGTDFGEVFEISTWGEIRNKKTRIISKQTWENLKCYSIIYYEGKVFRIKLGQAQEDSGLPRTILDRKPKRPVTPSSLMRVEIDELKQRVSELEKLTKHLLDK